MWVYFRQLPKDLEVGAGLLRVVVQSAKGQGRSSEGLWKGPSATELLTVVIGAS